MIANLGVYGEMESIPLHLQFQLNSGKILFKVLKLHLIKGLESLFELNSNNRYNTRTNADTTNLTIPFTHHERTRIAIGWWGCSLWNTIPQRIRESTSLRQFEQQYLYFLQSKLFSQYELKRVHFYDFV